jgi:hypothetical protein
MTMATMTKRVELPKKTSIIVKNKTLKSENILKPNLGFARHTIWIAEDAFDDDLKI